MSWYVTSGLASLTFLFGMVMGAWLNRYPWCDRTDCPHRRTKPPTAKGENR